MTTASCIHRLLIPLLMTLFLAATELRSEETFKHLNTIVIAIEHGPGRGNVGAAVIAANQLRAAGFSGDLYLLMPRNERSERSAQVLASMLPGYSSTSKQGQRLRSGTGQFEVFNYLAPEIDNPAEDPDVHIGPLIAQIKQRHPVDLILRFGKAVLSKANLARVRMHAGTIGTKGNLTVQIGESPPIAVKDSLGFFRLGFYGDDIIEDARSRIEADPKNRIAILSETLGALAEKNKPHLADFAKELATRARSEDVPFGIAYGVGYSATHPQLFAYIQSLASDLNATPSGRLGKGAILYSVSQLSTDELSAMRKKNFMRVIDLQRGEKIPDVIEAGRVTFVHIGGIRREAYAKLLMLSRLPAIVAGDSALSAAIASGRPFFMTQNSHNERTASDLATSISKLGASPMAHALERMSNGKIFDWKAVLTKETESAFSDLSKLHARPLALTLAKIADYAIDHPNEVKAGLERLGTDLKAFPCELPLLGLRLKAILRAMHARSNGESNSGTNPPRDAQRPLEHPPLQKDVPRLE